MKLQLWDKQRLLHEAKQKKLICYGAGELLKIACAAYKNDEFFESIYAILDTSKGGSGAFFEWNGLRKSINAIAELSVDDLKKAIILITIMDYVSVIHYLEQFPELDTCEFAIFPWVQLAPPAYTVRKIMAVSTIPKTIHYVWFGGRDIPVQYRQWMESWKRYCPDYTLVRWDENNYDISKHPYMLAAYRAGKYAFVSDYARLDIVYNYGGIYLDIDVELICGLDDLLYCKSFAVMNSANRINTGFGFGAQCGSSMLKEFLKEYDNIEFIDDPDYLRSNTCSFIQTRTAEKNGYVTENRLQQIKEMLIYPCDMIINTANYQPSTSNTVGYHHSEVTWETVLMKKQYDFAKQQFEAAKNIYLQYSKSQI